MVARRGKQVSRLLLRRWRLPQEAGDRVGMCCFGNPRELQVIFGAPRVVGVRGRGVDLGIKNLNLDRCQGISMAIVQLVVGERHTKL